MTNPHRFLFAVPEDIKVKALEVIGELYPYAGLLVVDTNWDGVMIKDVPVVLTRRSRAFDSSPVSPEERRGYEVAMRTAVCKFALGMARARVELNMKEVG